MPEGFNTQGFTLAQTQWRLGVTLGQIARRWRARLDARIAGHHGLTESRWLALLALARLGEGATQKALAARLAVEGPTLVRTLDWLEQQGFVERRESLHDRRAKTLHFTTRAAPVLEEIESVANGVRAEILAGISEADLSACLRVLEQVARNLGAEQRDAEEEAEDGHRPA
jgi:MarR family transcriptional regulator for hemolysin